MKETKKYQPDIEAMKLILTFVPRLWRSSMLLWAAERGYTRLSQAIIEKGADLNIRDDNPCLGETPLLLATKNGHIEIVKLLLKHGASVDECDYFRNTALILAAEKGDTEIVKVLLKYKATCWYKYVNGNGDNALSLAVKKGYVDIMDALLEKPDSALAVSSYEVKFRKPVLLLGNELLLLAAENGRTEIVSKLIDRVTNINYQDVGGNTALMKASYKGYHEIVNALIKAKADIHIDNICGETALFKAVAGNRFDIVKTLIKAGANVNPSEDYQIPPAQKAVDYGHDSILELLITHGASIEHIEVNEKKASKLAEIFNKVQEKAKTNSQKSAVNFAPGS